MSYDILTRDLMDACSNGQLEYVKNIVENHLLEYNTKFKDSVVYAAAYNNFDIVKYLFEQHKNTIPFICVKCANMSLYYAIKYLNIDIIKYILSYNICDFKYSKLLLTNLFTLYLSIHSSNSDEKIQIKNEIVELLYQYDEFVELTIYKSTHSSIPYYIKKYLFYHNLVDYLKDDKTKQLLNRTLLSISKKDDIKFFNDIIEKYDIEDIIKDNSQFLLYAVSKNSVNVLRKILTLNGIDDLLYNADSILYSLDFSLEHNKNLNISEAFTILLDDNRILQSVKKLMNELNDRTITLLLRYFNISSKDELLAVFNFFNDI